MTPTYEAFCIHAIDRKVPARFETLRLDDLAACGISLLGINASAALREQRLVVWERIANDLAPRHLARIGEG